MNYVGSIGSSCTQNINPFPTFDPRQVVRNGMFVEIETREDDQSKGIPFIVDKVLDMERQAAEDGTFTILWYEPRMPREKTDNPSEFHRRYFSCINRSWIPSHEPNDRILVDYRYGHHYMDEYNRCFKLNDC